MGGDAISDPFNFTHVQHLGYNKDSQQFNTIGLKDDMLKVFFEDGGLKHLIRSDEDRTFALNFIQEQCGMDVVMHV